MKAKRLAIIIFALMTGLTSPAVAADKVGSLSGSRDGTTGIITATWTVSTISGLSYFANRSTSGTLPVSGNQSVCQS